MAIGFLAQVVLVFLHRIAERLGHRFVPHPPPCPHGLGCQTQGRVSDNQTGLLLHGLIPRETYDWIPNLKSTPWGIPAPHLSVGGESACECCPALSLSLEQNLWSIIPLTRQLDQPIKKWPKYLLSGTNRKIIAFIHIYTVSFFCYLP